MWVPSGENLASRLNNIMFSFEVKNVKPVLSRVLAWYEAGVRLGWILASVKDPKEKC
jgi:hypothetical protein